MEEFEKLLAESFQNDLLTEPASGEAPEEPKEPTVAEEAEPADAADDDATAEIVLAETTADKTNPAA
jgi:hypothetical protein